jgi:hypothetical protein
LSDAKYARVDTLKTIHEISKGMVYLHKEGVLHGDFKVRQRSSLHAYRAMTNSTPGREHTCQ